MALDIVTYEVGKFINTHFPNAKVNKIEVVTEGEGTEEEDTMAFVYFDDSIVAVMELPISVYEDETGEPRVDIHYESNSDSLTLVDGTWYKDKSGTADPLMA